MEKMKFLSLILFAMLLCSCKTTITTSQQDTDIIPENGTLILDGQGVDDSGNEVAGMHLEWVSDLDGTLGTGKHLEISASTLTIGEHTITLQFKSFNDKAENASIRVIVRPLVYVCDRKEGAQHGDGIVNQITYYEYNDRTATLRKRWISEKGGEPTQIKIYHYGLFGVLEKVQNVDDDEWEYYTYDGEGRISTITRDHGNFSRKETRFYDEGGKLVRTEEDYDNDGTPDEARYYTYDDHGKKLSVKDDYGMDGLINAEGIYVNTYNDADQLISRRYDSFEYIPGNDPELVFNVISDYTWDENGNRIKSEQDHFINGTIDHIYTYHYSLR